MEVRTKTGFAGVFKNFEERLSILAYVTVFYHAGKGFRLHFLCRKN